ncbi:CCA tRNA nucleotidyltransferase [Picrophilus oshimae]|uniref:CCA-adding enzyme n=1 Tax=Picrophilus torridus (strain ATCC 700027 / DSM 9790 / JCM 10055 / NBRC 100828 / KAW 2/3) TaxID=1122961 RepID=CCA_PICTO|nr:CCA tRNA nucleotidyltransferase [Picrophilus oshimae]Q6L1N2.1 RecName: Full=CCA-adding enzyme; AltName: Full=CCA tRNA nucleotidyltransferase; AltName: Full=tRNA CCA-pyrophosphorylase; AltName: Full=tRNA adenylyl-/cytidylyl- transferase; AltName: Full=tRNA nucleotidyltransferase; AltName: Full=tRNA-NT [Picrophilus oshimae DSM 9789]AAT43120.1 tRNA nucleotidyltransferase [Picrophilus oshimae DSM 9789]
MIDYKKILGDYTPDYEESLRLKCIENGIIKKLNDIISSRNIDAEPVSVGSYSKGTNLKNSDLDIFIVFSKKYPKNEMESIGLSLGHYILENGVEKYAEHPYVSGYIENVKIDIVPAYKIEPGQRIVSTVDRTPLHTKYVIENTDENLRNDIRLLKIFMKANNVYGSEVSKAGFSGYLCEILVINFKSFDAVIKYFSKLKGRLIIPENSGKKFQEPVVIVDPVDPTRNAGAAVSLENLSRMKIASKLFLLNKNESFFYPREISPRYHKRGTCIYIITLKRPDIIDDIIYPQVFRFERQIFNIADRYGFMPVSSEINVDNNIEILIELQRDVLPDVSKHAGPPVDSDESINFINVWKDRALRGPYIERDRLYVDSETRIKSFYDALNLELKKMDIGKNLNKLKDGIKIIKYNNSDFNVVKKFFSKDIFH